LAQNTKIQRNFSEIQLKKQVLMHFTTAGCPEMTILLLVFLPKTPEMTILLLVVLLKSLLYY